MCIHDGMDEACPGKSCPCPCMNCLMGPKIYQVKVLDENGVQQGDAKMMTEEELDDLEAGLPEDWTTEYV
jgi:hypothetical protein